MVEIDRRQDRGVRLKNELCSCGQLPVPLGTSFLYPIVQNFLDICLELGKQ